MASLDELKKKYLNNKGEEQEKRQNPSSATSGSASTGKLGELKNKYLSTPSASSVDTTKGSEGWKKYLDDKAKAEQEAIAEEEDKKWWEKALEYLAEGSTTDTTLPTATMTTTIDALRNDDSYRRPNDDWSDEQRFTFGSLYLESPEKAFEYAEKANNDNNRAKEEKAIKEIQDNATSGFWAGAGNTVGAIAAAPLGMADFLNDLAMANAGRDIAPDGQISPFEYSQAVTGGIATHLNEEGGVLDEDIPIIGGKGWGDVYGLGTSIAQSMASAYTLGGAGTLVSYFGQGAAAGVDEALSRGASEEQAVLYGTALGAFEGLAEMVGVDRLFKLGSSTTVKEFIKNMLKQAGAEGAEEGLTSLFSNIADNVIMQDKSNFNALVNQYMAFGMSESEAKKKAWMDSIEGIAYDTIAGAISGGVSGGIHTTAQTIGSNIDAKRTYGDGTDLVAEALDVDASNTYAQKMQSRLDQGKNLTGGQINRLLQTNEAALVTQDKAKMKEAVEARLTELGETGDLSQLADVIVKAQSGGKLTSSERAVLVESKYGRRVSTELNPRSIESGEYTSQWAENIGTERINTEAYNKTLYDLASQKAGVTVAEETPSANENTSNKENTTQSVFEASERGKAKMGDTEVSIKEIASIKDGEITLRLEDGSTVKASDLELNSSADGLLYENVVHMNLNAATANAFINNYDGSIPANEYALGFSEAYRYGEYGFPAHEMSTEGFSAGLSQVQKDLAYNLGKTDAKYKVTEKQKAVSQKETTKGKVHYDGGILAKNMTSRQKESLKGLEKLAEALGIDIHVFESEVVDGKRQGANGWYDPKDGSIHIDLYAGLNGEGTMLFTAAHELTHYIRDHSPAKFKAFADFLFEQYGEKGISVSELVQRKREFLEQKGRITPNMTEAQANDLAYEEVVADSCEAMLADGEAIAKIAELKAKDKTLWQTIKDFIVDLVAKIKKVYEGLSPDSIEGRYVADMLDTAEHLKALWTEALVEASEASDLVEVDTNTESVAPLFSERTWTASEYVTEREETAKKIVKALGVDIKTAYKYIDDINGIARLIADDRARLDYEPNLDEKATVLKPNSEYKYSVDMSTLCAKRLLFTGTFDAIQRALPNTVFDSEDIVALREMMQKRDYEVACGICYVESTRREIGRITQDFIDSYKKAQESGKPITRTNSEGKEVDLKKTKDQMATTVDKSSDMFFAEKGYTPTLADLNTTDIDLVKRDHPLVYEAYLNFMNARGQAKPKLLETRAEYKGEILKHFKTKTAVTARNNAGGLRLQSFSDFEVPHMIDMMQIVMDMSRVGLKSQAYTKVPAFAEIFGDTGVKINLSLIAKGDGLDSKGNLIFDDVEGINHEEAFRLRDKFSKNVGTILVGKTDAHIIAAMADPRIDYIIPFHKSSWKESLYDALGLTGYADYTDFQNEKPIDKDRKIKNYDPSEYWDFTKTGDENAQIYLEKCREDGRIPKFPQFQGYPGYWKLLIDFKMYDNNGVGSPQEVVKPVFNTEASERILREYKGGHKSFPVAKDVVEDFVKEYKDKVKYSDRDSLDNYWDKRYNLYTATDDFAREVTNGDRHAFERSLANKTSGMVDGDTKTIHIYCRDKVYTFVANGYMQGYISMSEYVDVIDARKRRFKEYYENDFDSNGTVAGLWTKPIPDQSGRQTDDTWISSGRRGSASDDSLLEDTSNSTREGNNERVRENTYSQKEIDEIVNKLREVYGLDAKNIDIRYSDRNTASFNGKPFWIAMVNQRTGNIEATWTYEEAESEGFDLNRYEDIMEEDGYVFFTTDLLQDNDRIEYDDYGNRLPDRLIEKINKQIEVKASTNDAPLPEKIRKLHDEVGTLNKRLSNVTQWIEGARDWLEQRANNQITFEEYESRLRKDNYYRKLDDERKTLQKEMDGLIRELEAIEGKPWKMLRSNVLYATHNTRHSDRNPDSISNRSLLANALESVAKNDIERNKLNEYKKKIALIESEQAKLAELKGQIKELSFAKGKRDTETIKKLQFEANQAASRINTYDRQLLTLESTAALKGVLDREKQMAYKKAQREGKEALARYREKAAQTQKELLTRASDARKKGIESRRKTEMRHKIKDVVNELNQYLLKGTKDKHVPIELQKAVAEALDAVNMDTVGAEERIAKLQAELRVAKTLEDMQAITKKIEHIQEMGGNMEAKLSRLKTAYDGIINSDDPLVANSHDEVISNTIGKVIEIVGSTPIRDMSLYQLEAVYDMYKMVLTTVRNTNKAFKAKKSEDISVIANRVMEEIDNTGKKKPYSTKVGQSLSKFDWNNLKPIYAFERIGSDTFTDVFANVRAAEDAWAVDITEAREFSDGQRKKFKYDTWDFKKRYGFTSSSGKHFELSLDQIMSLYAYSKREQAKEHLKRGGIVIDETTEVTIKTKLGVNVKFNPTQATAYNLSDETLASIIAKLTPEQIEFVDVMQDYLSTTMGDKGNEVSLELYGVKLYKEKNYFPLKSATQFMAKAKEQQKGEVKIKNSGFSKETAPKASNPIVLTPFMDVWADHVNEMSMYHAFVLPLEDFYRVYNYKTPTSDTMATESVEMYLQNAYGKAATQYIDQLLRDLNGGARVDSTAGVINKLTGLFKKSAVFASLSVVVQQPSAIARASALVDAKYFIGKPTMRKHKESWAEVKKYAPVAIIKEMGYFDTGMGQSSVEWIKHDNTLKDKIDDVASKAPALADELSWCYIWQAVKREVMQTHKGLKFNSEEFLKVVGERFTEVVTKTQVYDSVLARSANMRSKDTGMKMVTAFMGEPTTSLNMLENALTQGKRGNKRYARKAIGSVISSMILNSILVSIVYAGRDDDEDKTYAEKYVGTLTEELLDSLNPLTLIPFVKDIVSIVQGYDVERSDMAVITDLINAWNNLDSDNRSAYRKVEDFGGAIASIFGLPVKNVMRDVRGMYNTINSFINGNQTTGAGIGEAVSEAISGKEKSDSQQLYEAILSGDSTQIERVKSRFKDQNAINSAIRKALRENDPRIKEAAEARYNGDIAEYMRIAKAIIAEGNFKQDDIVAAINSEISALKKGEGSSETTTSSNKVESIYKVDDYYAALVGRDQATAYVVKEDLIKTDVANGKDREEAEADFNSKFASYLREKYEDGDISNSNAKSMLINYAGKSEEDADSKIQYWDFKKEYPDYDLSEEAVKKYYEDVEPSGIGISTYYDYTKQRAKCKGTDTDGDGRTDSGSVKAEVLRVINSLPISNTQKDALYYLNGWSAKTIYEAPWH